MASLLAKGWDPKQKDYNGLIPADYALSCSMNLTNCQEVRKILGNSTQILTSQQRKVALGRSLYDLKAMVPSEISANAFAGVRRDLRPLLIAVIGAHKCTDEGHAIIQYLLEQGADPNATLSNNNKQPVGFILLLLLLLSTNINIKYYSFGSIHRIHLSCWQPIRVT